MMIKPKKKISNNKGFTLVELLITTLLISAVSLIIAGFLAVWLQNYADTRARTELLGKAELALDKINTDIRLSGAADDNNRWPDSNAPDGPSDPYSWESDDDTLILAKAAMDSDRNIIFSDPNKYIAAKYNVVYFLSGDKLYKRTLASDESNDTSVTTCPPAEASSSCPEDNLVADGVIDFEVSYYDAGNVEVQPSDARSIGLFIELTEKASTKNVTASYDTRMVFRNE